MSGRASYPASGQLILGFQTASRPASDTRALFHLYISLPYSCFCFVLRLFFFIFGVSFFFSLPIIPFLFLPTLRIYLLSASSSLPSSSFLRLCFSSSIFLLRCPCFLQVLRRHTLRPPDPLAYQGSSPFTAIVGPRYHRHN